MRAHGAFYRKGPILPNGPEIAVGMLLDILSIVASPLGRSDAYVELMEPDAKIPIPPNAPEIVVGMLRDILKMIAPSLGRSDAYVELIELYTRNADFTKRPRNRGGDAT